MRDLIKYKIHSISSVGGLARSANNNVFYDTYEEALEMVESYMRRDKCSPGFVITKTFAIIQPVAAPIKITLTEDL